MSNREQARCMRGLVRFWNNLKNTCTRFVTFYCRNRRERRRSTMENDANQLLMLRGQHLHLPNTNWNTSLDNWRAPPRKRYHHDRSPDTLLQIKIALQEQMLKNISAEDSQNRITKSEDDIMEKGEQGTTLLLEKNSIEIRSQNPLEGSISR